MLSPARTGYRFSFMHSMKSLRSDRASYLAAFLLGALLALLLNWPAHAADPFRLDRVGVIRLTALGPDKLLTQQGVLHLSGETEWRPAFEMARPANTPDWALNRPLITVDAYLAYHSLGFGALQGFELQEGAVTIPIGDQFYKAIAVNPEPYINDGKLINLSTRATLAGAGDEIIAGFVIERRTRAVLVRAVGPGLAKFGVSNALADPFLTVKQNGETLHTNDDWSAGPDAGLIAAAAARAGGFPLEAGSKDAARVLVLPPGVYTVHATTAGPAIAGGSVLVEVYSLPDDAIYNEV